MKKFTDLEAWKVGVELLKEIYAITRRLPREEMYGFTSQMRRSAVSILGNLAEGFGRFSYADKANKFTIARGEGNEIEAYIYGIVVLEFVTEELVQHALSLVDLEEKLLSGLISSCRSRQV